MPHELLKLAGFEGEIIELPFYYLYPFSHGPGEMRGVDYLRQAHDAVTSKGRESKYWKDENELIEQLVDLLRGQVFDYIVCPPSQHDFARSYLLRLKELLGIKNDLSIYLERNNQQVRATLGANVREIVESWRKKEKIIIENGASLLIVDDVVRDGRTLAALIYMLGGLAISQRVKVQAIAPFYVQMAGL